MQKVRGHLHSDSTPSWPTDHVARKGREMRHRCSPVFHAPRDFSAGRARCSGSPSRPDSWIARASRACMNQSEWSYGKVKNFQFGSA